MKQIDYILKNFQASAFLSDIKKLNSDNISTN